MPSNVPSLSSQTSTFNIQPSTLSHLSTANGHLFDFQRRHADADRHALSPFSAQADSAVQLEIISQGSDLLQRLGTIASEGSALDGGCYLAILDQVGFRGGKREFTAGDIYLPAPELNGI